MKMRTNSKFSASLVFADSRLQIFISVSPKSMKVVNIHLRNHDTEHTRIDAR